MAVLELVKGNKGEAVGGLIGIIEKGLQENDWKYHWDDGGRGHLWFGASGRNGDYKGVFFAREEQQIATLFVLLPVKVPEGRRKEVMEYLTRANFGLSIGNFEFDMDDGEIRYKISIDVEGGTLACSMVSNMLNAAFSTVDRYYPGLMSVIYGNGIPAAVVREAKG